MSMDGKRFGAGILGGALLGLLVVASTGLTTFGLYGSFTALSPAGITSTNAKGITAQTSTSTASSTNSSAMPAATSYTSTVSTATQPPSYVTDLASAFSPVSAQKSPSRLSNLAAQPILVDAVVLAPVLIALLVGVALYRGSAKRGKEEDEHE